MGRDFTEATLAPFDVILIGNPSGARLTYTPNEIAAIRGFAAGGGGVFGTYLMYEGDSDNSALADVFGLQPTAFQDGNTLVSLWGTVSATHPVTANVASPLSLLVWTYEQPSPAGWTEADLLPGASFVVHKDASESHVIAYEGDWRAVYFTGMAEYKQDSSSTKQLLYDALAWAGGYR